MNAPKERSWAALLNELLLRAVIASHWAALAVSVVRIGALYV